MPDPVKNFATSLVAAAPSPATTGVSLTVTGGDGSKFAAGADHIVCPAGADATSANAEIVRITAIATDTFTIIRQQQNTSARTIVIGDRIYQCLTQRDVIDIAAGDPLTRALNR